MMLYTLGYFIIGFVLAAIAMRLDQSSNGILLALPLFLIWPIILPMLIVSLALMWIQKI